MPKPVASPAMDIIDTVGMDELCHRIEAGESYHDLAVSLGVGVATLHQWINLTPERSEQSARARTSSAEAWLDKGMTALRDADGPTDSRVSVEIQRARAIAHECARRAAIRNPQYSERSNVALTGADGGSVKTEVLVSFVAARQATKP